MMLCALPVLLADHSEIDIVSISGSRRIFGKASFESAIHGRAKNVGASARSTGKAQQIMRELVYIQI
jgi:hypothetical protein